MSRRPRRNPTAAFQAKVALATIKGEKTLAEQFTSEAFTGRLKEEGIRISMDGKGRWRDNVFVERVWRSIKYEEVYLHAYVSVSEARQSIGRYIDFYNTTRPHSSLKAQTPDQVYFNRLPEFMAA